MLSCLPTSSHEDTRTLEKVWLNCGVIARSLASLNGRVDTSISDLLEAEASGFLRFLPCSQREWIHGDMTKDDR